MNAPLTRHQCTDRLLERLAILSQETPRSSADKYLQAKALQEIDTKYGIGRGHNTDVHNADDGGASLHQQRCVSSDGAVGVYPALWKPMDPTTEAD